MKLWAGRFQKETDTQVNDFNSSIIFDQRMYRQDIQGSLAHAAMLGRQGIITQEEADDIISGPQGHPCRISKTARWSSPWKTRIST